MQMSKFLSILNACKQYVASHQWCCNLDPDRSACVRGKFICMVLRSTVLQLYLSGESVFHAKCLNPGNIMEEFPRKACMQYHHHWEVRMPVFAFT